MISVKVQILNKNITVAENVKVADRFFTRLKGLMASSELKDGIGLMLVPCNCVHTWFMRYPIDVVFINKENIVVKIENSMMPYRIGSIVKQAWSVLELKAGSCQRLGITVGDRLEYAEE